MNILVPDSWLREYLDTPATPKQLKDCLSLCGPSIERINEVGKDIVYDIEITSNRVDMGSIYGIAREAAAILPRFDINATLKPMPSGSIPTQPESKLPLTIEDHDHLCHRIIAIVMDNVQVGQSPDWMKDRIEKSGVRSLNNLIDITNYVMLELGHPCHVFDYDRIATHKLLIRKAKKGEAFVTLDEKKYAAHDWDVIIDDGTGTIIDIPGIMGTANSVVTDNTKRIIFFIEDNDPINIRRTSMHHAIRTYAATLNEKQPDPELSKIALLRGIELYQQLAQAKPASDIIDIYPNPPKPQPINVSKSFIVERLGVDLPQKGMVTILKDLSFEVSEAGETLTVTPPTFRQFDIAIPEDIVEEVARLYGYFKLPSRLMTGEIPISQKPKDLPIEEKTKTMLKYWGYTELYNYSFISKDLIQKAGLKPEDHLKVANPLTEEIEYMRISLIPSMLASLEKNQYHKDTLALFELSNIYTPREKDLPDEVSILTIARTDDLHILKGSIESLFDELGVAYNVGAGSANQNLHPLQSGEFKVDGKLIATFGTLHPDLASKFGIQKPVYLAEINMREVVAMAHPLKKYTAISPYPPALEDLTLVIPDKTPVGGVIDIIKKADPLIREVELKDQYKDTITLRLTYQDPSKTITGEQVTVVREKILTALKERKITLKS